VCFCGCESDGTSGGGHHTRRKNYREQENAAYGLAQLSNDPNRTVFNFFYGTSVTSMILSQQRIRSRAYRPAAITSQRYEELLLDAELAFSRLHLLKLGLDLAAALADSLRVEAHRKLAQVPLEL
jgi:hypothetical protein